MICTDPCVSTVFVRHLHWQQRAQALRTHAKSCIDNIADNPLLYAWYKLGHIESVLLASSCNKGDIKSFGESGDNFLTVSLRVHRESFVRLSTILWHLHLIDNAVSQDADRILLAKYVV